MFCAGFARADITVFEPGTPMQGWAMPHNQALRVGTPLYVRAAVFERDGAKFAYVCADLNMISWALRRGVLAALAREVGRGLGAHNLMLTATHTHSAPGGLSQYLMFNAASFGFSPRVWSAVVDGVLRAITAADDAREPATLRLGQAEIPASEPVAFNRSLPAYRNNRDVGADERASLVTAVNRGTLTLRADDVRGRTLGVINWFGVHATNVHADGTALHGDNKGLAAMQWEREAAGEPDARPGFVAIFAQTCPGDVQPNFRFDRRRGLLVGAADDDHVSAAANADIQVRHARAAHVAALSSAPLDGPIRARALRVDMGAVEVDAADAGRRGARTSPAQIGLGQATGNHEGPGPLLALEPWLWRYAALRRRLRPDGDCKPGFLEVGRGVAGRVLGSLSTRAALPLVAPFEPMIGFANAAHRAGALGDDEPWAPNVLPLQLVELGGLVLAAVPAEPTVSAGRRLRATLAEALSARARPGEAAPRAIVINGYANAYSGYLATYEEYLVQEYEGAATQFGPHTLAAYQTMFRRLAHAPAASDPCADEPGPAPDRFDPAALIRQRVAGRRGVKGPGSGAGVPAPAHLQHLRAFSPTIDMRMFAADMS